MGLIETISSLLDWSARLMLKLEVYSRYNFTPRAKQVLALARREAALLNHDAAGAEHLLLGLIHLGQGVATSLLLDKDCDLVRTRSAVKSVIESGLGPQPKPPYAKSMREVLDMAVHESKSLKHSYIGTEHLLLGLLRHDDTVKVFNQLNFDRAQAHSELMRALTQ